MYQRKFLHSAVLTVTLLVAARDCFGQSTERNLVRSDPVLLLPLNEAAPTGNAGLFVGINEFTVDRHISGLQFAVHDAIELAYLFVVDLKLISPRSCHLLLSGQSSADDVQRHLAELRQQGCVIGSAQRSQILAAFLQVTSQGRGTSDVLVCAFSSHGFNQGRQAYIMPSDGARELLQDTAIPVDSIETRMEASKAGHRLLLVDACQERISARSTAGAVTGTPMSPLFLELLKLPTGQAKLASCSPGEFSYEHGTLGGVGHGIFTYSFLEALRGGARPDEQNLVRLGTVADYVSSRVTEWAKQGGRQPQTPFFAGPEAPRKLPLAVQASNLAALIMSVEKYSTSMDFTPELRSQLVAVLKQLDATREADRRLAVQTREFAAGRLSEFVYVPYLESELRRRRGGVPQPLRAPFDTATARRAQQDWSRFLGTTVTQENSIGMKLALIPAGEFRMGSPENEEERSSGEYQHRVRITKPFYLGVYEVTQGEYERVMGENPSWFSRGGG
ncbi:MAG: caspase family protein, partial [Pirellulaceae bacterium]